MGDIYNDKMRHDNFQGRQDDIENNIQSTANNYSNELVQSKLADVQNKTIGSELMFSSIPASIGKGAETYSRVKGLYQKIQALPEKVSDIVDTVKGKATDLVDSVKGKALDSPLTAPTREVIFDNPLYEGGETAPTREVQFDNPLFEGGEKPVAETFGSVKSYIGGQVGDLGDKVSVLPNSVGSLKQAIPKPQDIQDAVSDISSNVKSTVSDVSDVAGDVVKSAVSGATDIATEGASILAEAAVPIVGDVLALGSLVFGGFEGIKDLVDKPKAPPVPTVNAMAGSVSQAGI